MSSISISVESKDRVTEMQPQDTWTKNLKLLFCFLGLQVIRNMITSSSYTFFLVFLHYLGCRARASYDAGVWSRKVQIFSGKNRYIWAKLKNLIIYLSSAYLEIDF